jgi:hypothetical protein
MTMTSTLAGRFGLPRKTPPKVFLNNSLLNYVVESFLNQYQNTSISYSEGVVFHEKHILTREEILYIHFRQKSTPIRPLADILRNYTWSPYKPHYRATWTEQEVRPVSAYELTSRWTISKLA